MGTRTFSAQFDNSQSLRSVDADAPMGFRLELVDVVLQLADSSGTTVSDVQLYGVMIRSMGIDGAPGKPMNGYRRGIDRQIRVLDWKRVYDLICRWWTELPVNHSARYLQSVNAVL